MNWVILFAETFPNMDDIGYSIHACYIGIDYKKIKSKILEPEILK